MHESYFVVSFLLKNFTPLFHCFFSLFSKKSMSNLHYYGLPTTENLFTFLPSFCSLIAYVFILNSIDLSCLLDMYVNVYTCEWAVFININNKVDEMLFCTGGFIFHLNETLGVSQHFVNDFFPLFLLFCWEMFSPFFY